MVFYNLEEKEKMSINYYFMFYSKNSQTRNSVTIACNFFTEQNLFTVKERYIYIYIYIYIYHE